MKAMITGASSGIGKSIAIELSKLGYDLVLVSRDKKKLKELDLNAEIITLDLSEPANCIKLMKKVKDIDILVNCAGFGCLGEFKDTNLEDELNMIDINIKAVHILSKLFLKKYNKGYILNVASTAAFTSGPLMASYYATNNYVLALTEAIYEENRNPDIHISCLCPGPVKTNFNNSMNAKDSFKGMNSDKVSEYAIKKMFKNKLIIIPGISNRISVFMIKILSRKLILKINHIIQRRKLG